MLADALRMVISQTLVRRADHGRIAVRGAAQHVRRQRDDPVRAAHKLSAAIQSGQRVGMQSLDNVLQKAGASKDHRRRSFRTRVDRQIFERFRHGRACGMKRAIKSSVPNPKPAPARPAAESGPIRAVRAVTQTVRALTMVGGRRRSLHARPHRCASRAACRPRRARTRARRRRADRHRARRAAAGPGRTALLNDVVTSPRALDAGERAIVQTYRRSATTCLGDIPGPRKWPRSLEAPRAPRRQGYPQRARTERYIRSACASMAAPRTTR